jgi:hypothetical protein
MATVQQGNGIEAVTGVNCNLHYEQVLSGTASTLAEYTLIGESADPATSVDQVIVVDCTVANLNSVLSYTGNWVSGASANGVNAVDGTQPYPTCEVDFTELAAAASLGSNLALEFGKISTTGNFPFLMTDDSGDNTLWKMQSYFTSPDYVFTDNATSTSGVAAALLNGIPGESVKKVEVKNLTVMALSQVVASAATDAEEALELFKQADAAGKIPGGGDTAFVAGDSITFYVDYALSKGKKFILDPEAEATKAKFTINGQSVAITDGDELASTKTVRIGWQFRAQA